MYLCEEEQSTSVLTFNIIPDRWGRSSICMASCHSSKAAFRAPPVRCVQLFGLHQPCARTVQIVAAALQRSKCVVAFDQQT
mmetsp:Transcript_10484/g.31481  ORF Transcript_10484/g.31481 Transcript_10484/m.31481 type:complete len:81 (-) Transcript_10484:369-611(-)